MSVPKVVNLISLIPLIVITDALTIDLNITNKECVMDNRTHDLFEGDYLNFQMPAGFYHQVPWFHDLNQDGRTFVMQRLPMGLFSIANVSTDMSTTWQCTLLKPGDINCNVMIVVLERFVTITTNGKRLGAQLVDNSPSELYAEYIYQYQDGEIVDTTCSNVKYEGNLRLEYRHEKNNTLFTVRNGVAAINPKFRSLMKLERNNSYLDCIYAPVGSNRRHVHRTYFTMKESVIRTNDVGVLVNGLLLVRRPYKVSKTATAEYQYYYINGEPITLECREYTGRRYKVFHNVTNRYNGSKVPSRCRTSKKYVKIIFESELTPDNRPPTGYSPAVRISGLQANNILYQYTSDVDEWTIHYQYTRNETLNLACVSTAVEGEFNFDLFWRFREGLTIPSPQNVEYNVKNTLRTSFTLGDADNMTIITCLAKPKINNKVLSKVVLKLHNISPVVPEATDNNEVTAQNGMPQIPNDNSSHLGWYIAGATFGTVIIVVLICVPMMYRYRKTKIRSPYENPRYETVDEDDRPIPIFPSQWNDYGESDSHYTKIDDGQMVVNNYYQGIGQDRSSNVTQNHYTEIIYPEAGSGGNSKEYAEVMKSGHQRRNDKYSNILSGGRYANTSASADYAEPAYCDPQLAVARPVYTNSGSRQDGHTPS